MERDEFRLPAGTHIGYVHLQVSDLERSLGFYEGLLGFKRALETERSIGLLLPCNVVVRRDGDHTLVQALDPGTMVTLTGLDALRPVAEEATARLDAALAALSAP